MKTAMNWSVSTITFRMCLYSPGSLVRIAKGCGFAGIELWEQHWRNTEADFRYWREKHPEVKFVAFSGYMDLTDLSDSCAGWRVDLERKMDACRTLGIPVLRLFTGATSSLDASKSVWQRFFDRLEYVHDLANRMDVEVAFETHPNTLLDSRFGVEQLLEVIAERNWHRVGINFDGFHVWEYGVDPRECLKTWYPYVKHVHLKNASGRTANFAPANVFSPLGRFGDLTPLSAGVVNVFELVQYLFRTAYGAAITVEWFGQPDIEFLKSEVQFLNSCCAIDSWDPVDLISHATLTSTSR